MSYDEFTCPTCGHKHNEQACPVCVSRLREPQTNYRSRLNATRNDLHRQLTGAKSGSSRYKILWGRYCQVTDDLAVLDEVELQAEGADHDHVL